jgi:HSP20 family molecular chaperone IbpA
MMNKNEVVEVKNRETPEGTTAAIFDELKRDLADWMTTDRDMVSRPVTELTKEGDEFAVRTLVPGIKAKDIEVMIAPEILLIKGEIRQPTAEHHKLLKSVTFPQPVNPERVHAEIRDGMLSIHVKAAAAKLNRFVPIAA